MFKINGITNKTIRKLIIEAKMAELDLQNKRSKSQKEDPQAGGLSPLCRSFLRSKEVRDPDLAAAVNFPQHV